MIRHSYYLVLVFVWFLGQIDLHAQLQVSSMHKQEKQAHNRIKDSIWILQLPQLEFPENFHSRELPAVHDNSNQPYLRPVFYQIFWNCGQASSVAYAFTYEINRLRNLPANDSANQYPPDFVYNFMNDIHGGVSFFHTFSVLEKCGTPTVEQYGGFQLDDTAWMSGNDKYLAAMQNRLEKVMSIDVGSEEGILKLKHWLVHHMEDSDVGGVALFSASSPWNLVELPQGTPEAGKLVITGWGEAGHNMTIVGYNDSIRYDYNGDGKYTNNKDLNGDEIINVKDWEIGGVKVVNSYGIGAHDSGFFYATYKSLAESYQFGNEYTGGIWNNSVVLIDAKTPYQPLLTLKTKIYHQSRHKIKIRVGIASDTIYHVPTVTMDFPIFNFQGGDLPMQGFNDTIELGLDITPLLAYVNPNSTSRIFLMIDEIDPEDKSYGELLEMEVYDHAKDQIHTSAKNVQKSITNNNTTYASVVKNVDIQLPIFDQDTIPTFTGSDPYEFLFTASEGTPPYKWHHSQYYIENAMFSSFPADIGEKIPNENFNDPDWGRVAVPLPFTFPYYGKKYDTIWVHIDGFIKFEESDAPWPYFIDKDLQLQYDRMIAPLFTDLYIRLDNGVWIESTDSSMFVRWKAEAYHLSTIYESDFNFALRLFEDGNIEFYYGSNYTALKESWASGISDGGEQSYQFTQKSNHFPIYQDQMISLYQGILPADFKFTEEGYLSCSPSGNQNYVLNLHLTDRNRITISKQFLLTNALQIDYNNAMINGSGETRVAVVNLDLKNRSDKTFENIWFSFEPHSEEILLSDSLVFVDIINPYQEISIDNAFIYSYDFDTENEKTFSGRIIAKNDTLIANRPYLFNESPINFLIGLAKVEDGNNGKMESGETANLVFEVINHSPHVVSDIVCELFSDDPYLTVLDDLQKTIELLNPYSLTEVSYKVHLNDKAPNSFLIDLDLSMISDLLSNEYRFKLNVNSDIKDIAIVYFTDYQAESAIRLRNLIREYNYFEPDLLQSLTPVENHFYKVLILNLGSAPSNYELTGDDSPILENYLNSGGNLLLQGGGTFNHDDQLPVHDYFYIEGNYDGWLIDIDSLQGVSGTFTENMLYSYYGVNHGNDNLEPKGDAFTFLKEPSTGYGFAIAYDGENYKTIGSSVDLFAIVGLNENSSDMMLLEKILEFFNMELQLAANFVTQKTRVCADEQVQFMNLSSSFATDWMWRFPGGDPEFSSETNPTVIYSLPGTYDVELIAFNNSNSDTLVKEQHIVVEKCLSIIEKSVLFEVFPNPVKNNLTIRSNNRINGKMQIMIWDLYGREVMFKELNPNDGYLNTTISTASMMKGMYIIAVNKGGKKFTKKVLVN